MLEELFFMGERGAPAKPGRVSRDSLIAALALYPHLYGDEDSHRIPVTFRALWFIGWRPGPTAPRPKQRGSAQRSFKELANKTKE
jgi:NADH dehydrogenase [ubiquinone] 1 alpha subcomplex assembly factor 5